jgi:hypothetical protein
MPPRMRGFPSIPRTVRLLPGPYINRNRYSLTSRILGGYTFFSGFPQLFAGLIVVGFSHAYFCLTKVT